MVRHPCRRDTGLSLFEALYQKKNPGQRQRRSESCVKDGDKMEREQLEAADHDSPSDHHHHDQEGLPIQEAIDRLLLLCIAEHPGRMFFDQSAKDHKVKQKEHKHGEQIIDNRMIIPISQNPDPQHVDPCDQPYGSRDNQQVFL